MAKNAKNAEMFLCEKCNYKSSKKSDYDRHLRTRKHKILINTYQKAQKTPYYCLCGKQYKHAQSLYTHKKKCQFKEEEEEQKEDDNEVENKDISTAIISAESSQDFKQMFLAAMEKNNEILKIVSAQQQQIGELIPKVGNTTNIKQKFNINIFLNEKCKDAISMDQFIDQVQVSMKNLITTKDKGLGEGLSNIIIDNMNKLSLYERPMHCTDVKRETLYIKNNEWEKDEKKDLINELLKKVEKKQMKNIDKWTDEHPKFQENEQEQEEYIGLVRSCTGSMDQCKDKIIKKVCDNVYVNKSE